MAASAARRFDDPVAEPPLALDRARVDFDVTSSLKTGWLRDAKELVAPTIAPEDMLHVVARLVNLANTAIEAKRFGIDENDLSALKAAREKESGYYRAPIIAAYKQQNEIAAPLAAPALQSVYETLGLGSPARLIVPHNRRDLEEIGTQHDFLSMLFWAEIQSLHSQQIPWTNRAYFDALIADAPPPQRKFMTDACNALGHEIHVIVANNTVDLRRAKYFIHVTYKDEQQFEDKLNSSQSIDMADYGGVIASYFLDSFRQKQSERAYAGLKDIVDRYVALAVRERDYHYQASNKLADFRIRRFNQAILDDGSRQALLKELTEQFVEHRSAAASVAEPTKILFPYRLTDDGAAMFIKIARERHLTLPEVAAAARFVTHCTVEAVATLASDVADVCHAISDDAEAFDAFVLLVAQNRSLTNPYALSAAVSLASKGVAKGQHARRTQASRFMPFLGLLIAARSVSALMPHGRQLFAPGPREKVRPIDWVRLRGTLVALDLMLHAAPDASALLDLLRNHVADFRARTTDALCSEMQNIAKSLRIEKGVVVNPDVLRQYGIGVESHLEVDIFSLLLPGTADTIEHEFLAKCVEDGFVKDIKSLTIVGRYIEAKPYNEKFSIVRELLSNGLEAAFAESDFPVERRDAFLDRLTDTLLSRARDAQGPAHPQGSDLSNSTADTVALPKIAPIKWKDREPGETPPDFVRRAYGRWAVDGDGIGKRALRSLDPTLVTELNKWVRGGNEMPDDIKLLTVGEENAKLLQAGPDALRKHLGKFTGEEAVREAARLRMAQGRQ